MGTKNPSFEDRPMDVYHLNPKSQTEKITGPTTVCILTQLALTGKGQFMPGTNPRELIPCKTQNVRKPVLWDDVTAGP